MGGRTIPVGLRHTRGEWHGKVLSEFEKLCLDAMRIFDAFQKDGHDAKFSITELADLVCEALAVNYRISCIEVGILGLLSTDLLMDIIFVLLDLRVAAEMINELSNQKKSA
jgi:hypothetical protein